MRWIAPIASELILPPPPQSTQGFGCPRLTLLNTLKASMRNLRLVRSVIIVTFARAMSLWKN